MKMHLKNISDEPPAPMEFSVTNPERVTLANALSIPELRKIGKEVDIQSYKGVLLSIINDSLLTNRNLYNLPKFLDILAKLVIEEYKIQNADELNKTIAELLKGQDYEENN